MIQEADFNHEDFSTSNQQAGDDTLLVKFELRSKQDRGETLKQGRPIFKDVEYVDIKIPGRRGSGACRPASFADKQRFPKHYAAFKQRTEAPDQGTPLAEWPQITRSQAEELAFVHVKTVEQLSELADSAAGEFMGGHKLKQLAKDWLTDSGETALIAEKEALKEQVTDLTKQVAHLTQLVQEINNAPKAEVEGDVPAKVEAKAKVEPKAKVEKEDKPTTRTARRRRTT